MTRDTLGAVILAGGLARRMGGVDKGLVQLGGQSMCERVAGVVAPLVARLVISANRNQAEYAALGLPVVADTHSGHLGPLAGLSAALAELSTDYVFMCPCDSPFIQPALVERLAAACRQPGIDVAVAHDGEREQPVFCVVARQVAASLSEFLDAGERKIDRWYAGRSLARVDCSDLADSFRNINTPEELAAAERDLGPERVERRASCEDPDEPALLPVDEARRRLAGMVSRVSGSERISLRQAHGRVLAQTVQSPMSVPAQDNSAMDGYTIAAGSIPASGTAALDLIGTAWAGKPFVGPVAVGQAVRIFTGAILPAGADTVVIQEHCDADERQVRIDSRVQAGRNVRARGEDVESGAQVFAAGERLGAAHLGVLASLGIAQIEVVRPVRVAFFSTGDELHALEQQTAGSLPPGALFDSNRYTMLGLLDQPGVEAIDLGLVPDEPEATRNILQAAAAQADLVISSGGVSAGDADYVSRVFNQFGEVAFWRIAIRPGRPLVVGRLGEAAFFGLPGNPVAVMVTYLKFVRPALQTLMGMPPDEPPLVPAVCTSPLRKNAGREEYQRGVLSVDADGRLEVASTGKQGAGRLTSMSTANCLIVLPVGRGAVSPGETVQVQLFHGLLG